MEMRAMYAQCLAELMEQDPKLVLLDADLSKACGTFPLRKRFPDRIFDCGVAEQNMISIAAGLASYGFNNIQYFSRKFKEYMKCTPKQYQKKRKKLTLQKTLDLILYSMTQQLIMTRTHTQATIMN